MYRGVVCCSQQVTAEFPTLKCELNFLLIPGSQNIKTRQNQTLRGVNPLFLNICTSLKGAVPKQM